MKPQLIVFAFLAAFLISAHAYNFRLHLLGPRSRKRESIFDDNKRASNEWNRSGI